MLQSSSNPNVNLNSASIFPNIFVRNKEINWILPKLIVTA